MTKMCWVAFGYGDLAVFWFLGVSGRVLAVGPLGVGVGLGVGLGVGVGVGVVVGGVGPFHLVQVAGFVFLGYAGD
jgi:hypothetical protein